jgi:hypothetical protein
MSANLLDLFTAHAGAREVAIIESAFRPERRKRARTQVHWSVLLLCDREANTIETVTQNLSSSGFYCLSSKPLTPGESLSCALKVPAFDPKGEDRSVALECRVQVMRAEAVSDGLFGIACRIEDYHLVTGGTRA